MPLPGMFCCWIQSHNHLLSIFEISVILLFWSPKLLPPSWSYSWWPQAWNWIIFHCIDILHFVYPFICSWKVELFPPFLLLWTLVCEFLCGHMFWFFNIYIGVELLSHLATLAFQVSAFFIFSKKLWAPESRSLLILFIYAAANIHSSGKCLLCWVPT